MSRPVSLASVDDVHATALAMPHVTVESAGENPVYQVGGKTFVFFRNPRKDSFDPETGERYDDVIVIWVADEVEKQAILAEGPPWFTNDHFNGHPSVLVRASQLDQLDRDVVVEVVQSAWLARASATRAKAWLAERGLQH
ncbi:MmcQ/YjbR family DNA-binding protein [Aestuariimicrobium ganziense]|uniref:MmcQ/YjbR family DNA-binding protein n=1 Tax=Aestuariimicrobium ganziense TaxID=2773677 RepID=UPI001F316966|nr:MmcQ/YjbR family DNA-binding protein [Aestuariimicrobium ganziense]